MRMYVADGASPARVSPLSSQEASEPGTSGGAVHPGRVRRLLRYLEDFAC